jgi:tRNA(fMet)-specific endonuclease VapC
MGLILDSSVLIPAERRRQSVRELLTSVSAKTGETDIAISAITLVELAHGVVRANTPERQIYQALFLRDVRDAIPVRAVTAPLAMLAGEVDGRNQQQGVRVPLADLLIGVTALHAGDSVATRNLRHFRMIPGLSVVTF